MSARQAKKVCGDAMIGTGEMWSRAVCRECPEISTVETLVAFNGRDRGSPAIFLLGAKPSPNSEARVFVFKVRRATDGAGYTLAGTIPESLYPELDFRWRISYFALSLHHSFQFAGRPRSYLTASCPTSDQAKNSEVAVARGIFFFGDAAQLSGAIRGECGAW
jgi:hypothetical protein